MKICVVLKIACRSSSELDLDQASHMYSCINLSVNKEQWEPKITPYSEWRIIAYMQRDIQYLHTHRQSDLEEAGRITVQETACSHVSQDE